MEFERVRFLYIPADVIYTSDVFHTSPTLLTFDVHSFPSHPGCCRKFRVKKPGMREPSGRASKLSRSPPRSGRKRLTVGRSGLNLATSVSLYQG